MSTAITSREWRRSMGGIPMRSEYVSWAFRRTQPPMPSFHGIGYLPQLTESSTPRPMIPLAIGVDVARFGTTFRYRRRTRPVIEEVHEYTKLDGVDIAAWTEYHVHELHKENETYGVGIDIIGVGSSVYDQLNRFTAIERLYAVNVAETASDESRFASLRMKSCGMSARSLNTDSLKSHTTPNSCTKRMR